MDKQLEHLEDLRKWRGIRQADLSLRFIKEQFKRDIEKPYKQLQSCMVLWEQLVPWDLVRHTRLESLKRGVLRVSVDSSSRLYELDRLLRLGLERQLITQHRGSTLRRVELRVAGPDYLLQRTQRSQR